MKKIVLFITLCFIVNNYGKTDSKIGENSTLKKNAKTQSIDDILARWKTPSKTNIMVVAHRAAFMENRQIVLPENSIASIEYAIELGVDMVEVDIRSTKDGRFVILHDSDIKRTTNGAGKIADLTFEQAREFYLINEVNGEITQHKIPSIEEVYETVKGRIMVNLDPKIDILQLKKSLLIAKKMGVEKQIILKSNADTEEERLNIKNLLSELPFEVDYMPMHWDKNFTSIKQIEKSLNLLKPEAVEMVIDLPIKEKSPLTESGGMLFSEKVKALSKKYNTHLWINTLYVDAITGIESQWNGGRHDILGLKYPDSVFGFWVEQGATIIQTDEPKYLLNYLKSKGYRK